MNGHEWQGGVPTSKARSFWKKAFGSSSMSSEAKVPQWNDIREKLIADKAR